jgi:predicted dienelactone hydrolase
MEIRMDYGGRDMTHESIRTAVEGAGMALLLTLLSTSIVTTASAADELTVTANAHVEAPAYDIKVGRVETVVLHDRKRNKELQCRITYPSRAAGPCPIVIFSHGAIF